MARNREFDDALDELKMLHDAKTTITQRQKIPTKI